MEIDEEEQTRKEESLEGKVDYLVQCMKKLTSSITLKETSCKAQVEVATTSELKHPHTTMKFVEEEDDTTHESDRICTLIKACRSLEEIEAISGCFIVKKNRVVCKVCFDYLNKKAGSTSTLGTAGNTSGVFNYDPEQLGRDFRLVKHLPREFRNLKSHLTEHLSKKGSRHLESVEWSKQQSLEEAKIKSLNVKAGMSCGRLAYKIIVRGRPYTDYTGDVLIEEKNGGFVGNLNHSD